MASAVRKYQVGLLQLLPHFEHYPRLSPNSPNFGTGLQRWVTFFQHPHSPSPVKRSGTGVVVRPVFGRLGLILLAWLCRCCCGHDLVKHEKMREAQPKIFVGITDGISLFAVLVGFLQRLLAIFTKSAKQPTMEKRVGSAVFGDFAVGSHNDS